MIKRIIILFITILSLTPSAHAKEKWEEYRARHFYIYSKDAPKDFIRSVEEAAEEYYDEITRNLGFTRYKGWSFDDRAKIYIYADKEDYLSSSKQAKWSHGVAYAKEKVIRTFPSAHGFFDSTLPHELGHIIFREFIGYRTPVPSWMDEGVAMYQEKARRWGADKAVKKAIGEGRFMSIEALSLKRLTGSTEKEVVQLYYAEAASIVNYLINELGKPRFVKFCRKLKDGQPFYQAFFSVYQRFKTMKDFNKRWLEYLK